MQRLGMLHFKNIANKQFEKEYIVGNYNSQHYKYEVTLRFFKEQHFSKYILKNHDKLDMVQLPGNYIILKNAFVVR